MLLGRRPTSNRYVNYTLFLIPFVVLLHIFTKQFKCHYLSQSSGLSNEKLLRDNLPTYERKVISGHGIKLGFNATSKSPQKYSVESQDVDYRKILKVETVSRGEHEHNRADVSNSNENLPVISVKDKSVYEFMKNISRPYSNAPDLFITIPEENYLIGNKSFFTARPGVKNDLDYPFFIRGENICGDEDIAMLIIIPSVPSHLKKRDAIRRTWLGAGENNTWPRVDIRGVVKHIFMLGGVERSLVNTFILLKQESEVHNDIVMAAFQDSYRNLTIKGLVGLHWTMNHCNTAQVVLKVDEDTFINIPLMLQLLHDVKKDAGTDKFVLGLKHLAPKPKVVRQGRWAVTKEEYPLDFFPHYMYGHTYAVSRGAVKVLVETSKKVMLIAPEDAFITGILPKCAGVTRLSAPSFTMYGRYVFDCEIVRNKRVAVTTIHNVTDMEELWKRVEYNTCNPDKAWKLPAW